MCDPPPPPRRPPSNSGFYSLVVGQPRPPPHNTGYSLRPGGPTRPSPESDYFSSPAGLSHIPPNTSRLPSAPSTVGFLPMPTRGGGPPSTAGFIPMPYNPGPNPPSSNQFRRPVQKVSPPRPTAVQEQAVAELNELSRMVCKEHYHRSTTLDLIPSGRTEGYSVQWQCEMLFWNLKVCVNCGFKRIKCSKRVEAPNQEGNLLSLKTHLHILGVWEGIMCEHVLRLHRIGELNKNWWKNDVDLTGAEERIEVKPRYKICAPRHVRCHPPLFERSRR